MNCIAKYINECACMYAHGDEMLCATGNEYRLYQMTLDPKVNYNWKMKNIMVKASGYGYITIVRKFIKTRICRAYQDEAFKEACAHGQIEIARLFKFPSSGYRLFIDACIFGDLELVKFLSEYNTGIGMSKAFLYGYIDIINYLLKKGYYNTNLFLCDAMVCGKWDVINLALNLLPDDDDYYDEYCDALIPAIRSGILKNVALLLELGAKPNLTAVKEAVSAGYIEIYDLLFQSVKPNRNDINDIFMMIGGKTPIEIVKKLVNAGASDYDRILDYAIYRDNVEGINYLINELGYKPSKEQLNNLLFDAISYKSYNVVELIYTMGGFVNMDYTELHKIYNYSNFKLFRLVITNSQPNKKIINRLFLDACHNMDSKGIDLLLKLGASNFNTALYTLVSSPNQSVKTSHYAELLIYRGARNYLRCLKIRTLTPKIRILLEKYID